MFWAIFLFYPFMPLIQLGVSHRYCYRWCALWCCFFRWEPLLLFAGYLKSLIMHILWITLSIKSLSVGVLRMLYFPLMNYIKLAACLMYDFRSSRMLPWSVCSLDSGPCCSVNFSLGFLPEFTLYSVSLGTVILTQEAWISGFRLGN